MTLEVFYRSAQVRTSACDDNALRAFDKTVRRKPLAFAADAVYGNSIDLELEGIAKKGVARKAWLLMLVNALLPAFNPVMVRRGCSYLQAQTRSHLYTRQRPPRQRLRSHGLRFHNPLRKGYRPPGNWLIHSQVWRSVLILKNHAERSGESR